MSVFQRADGRWIVRFSAGSIPEEPERKEQSFGRGPQAEAQARRLNAQYCLKRAARRKGPDFDSIAGEYLKARKYDIAETTAVSMTYSLDAHILPYMGAKVVYGITHDLLDKYVQSRKQPQVKRGAKKPDGTYATRTVRIKNATVHRELSIVKAIMSWAQSRGLITSNPIAKYKLPKRDDLIQPPPTTEEISKLLRVASPHLKRAILLAYYTCARPGESELLSILWSNVDFANRTIFVESAKKGGVEHRTIPIHDVLLKHLQAWHREDKALQTVPKGVTKCPEFIVHYKGNQVVRLKTAWNRAKRAAGITRTMKLYSLRHAGITALMASGVDPRTVAGIAGNSLEVMLTNYFRSSSQMRVSAIEGMPDITETKKGEGLKLVTG
jgi:integrase